MVTPSPRGAVSRAGPATHAVETSTRDKGSATAAAAAGRSTKKNRASSTIRLAFEVWGWVCVLILVYGMYEGLDERRVHMLNVYYQAPVVVTVACGGGCGGGGGAVVRCGAAVCEVWCVEVVRWRCGSGVVTARWQYGGSAVVVRAAVVR